MHAIMRDLKARTNGLSWTDKRYRWVVRPQGSDVFFVQLDAALFGRFDGIGKHVKPESVQDLLNAFDDALSKGFERVYVYVE